MTCDYPRLDSRAFMTALVVGVLCACVTVRAEEVAPFSAVAGVMWSVGDEPSTYQVVPISCFAKGLWSRECLDLPLAVEEDPAVQAACKPLRQHLLSTTFYSVDAPHFRFVPTESNHQGMCGTKNIALLGTVESKSDGEIRSRLVTSIDNRDSQPPASSPPALEALAPRVRAAMASPLEAFIAERGTSRKNKQEWLFPKSRGEKLDKIVMWMVSGPSQEEHEALGHYVEEAGISAAEAEALMASLVPAAGFTPDPAFDITPERQDLLLDTMIAYLAQVEKGKEPPAPEFDAELFGELQMELVTSFWIEPGRPGFWVQILLPYPMEQAPKEPGVSDFPSWSCRYWSMVEVLDDAQMETLWECVQVLTDPWNARRRTFMGAIDLTGDGKSEVVVHEGGHEHIGYLVYSLEGDRYTVAASLLASL